MRLRVFAALAAQQVLSLNEHMEVLIDAGSTGSRMYVFHSHRDGESVKLLNSHIVGKMKPGLSSFQDKPEKAHDTLTKLFDKFITGLDAKFVGTQIPVKIFGTAGMRLLPDEKRSGVWKAVSDNLNKYFKTVEDKAKFDLQATSTIPGDLEGFYAVLGVNHLMKSPGAQDNIGRLDDAASQMQRKKRDIPCERYGILDLGGSSTQIAIPSDCTDISQHNSFVRSFPKSGMELTRNAVNSRFTPEERANCYFEDFETENAHKSLARPCTELIKEAMEANNEEGTETPIAIPRILNSTNSKKDSVNFDVRTTRFVAVSGFLYVTHFINWLLKHEGLGKNSYVEHYPNPPLSDLIKAAGVSCNVKWEDVQTYHKQQPHEFTGNTKLPHRCFEINYIATLLKIYNNGCETCSNVWFTDSINGSEVEWPIGAWLHSKMFHKEKKIRVEL